MLFEKRASSCMKTLLKNLIARYSVQDLYRARFRSYTFVEVCENEIRVTPHIGDSRGNEYGHNHGHQFTPLISYQLSILIINYNLTITLLNYADNTPALVYEPINF